jgi:membrane associated rhomboid family serine protease
VLPQRLGIILNRCGAQGRVLSPIDRLRLFPSAGTAMGLYDREYYRSEDENRFPGSDQPMVFVLIAITVVLFLADYFSQGRLGDVISLKADLFRRPWNVWQLVTYGFAHDRQSILHVGFNMFALWLFGRDVEGIYGRRTFARLYMTGIVMAGLAWVVSEQLTSWEDPNRPPQLIGASGAISSVMVVYAFHFPRRMFYLWFVLPIPAALLIVLYILNDIGGAIGVSDRGGNVAYMAHLGGAAYGLLFYRTQWSFGRILPNLSAGGRGRKLSWPKRRPKLRLHDAPPEETDWQRQVDEVLEKITREGESSLTPAERRKLEEASRRFQERRR